MRTRRSYGGVVTATTVDDRAWSLAGDLVDKAFGTVEVAKAWVTTGLDADGDRATFLDLVLKNPVGDTWPVEDMLELRRAVASAASRADLESVLYVRVSPEADDVQEDEPLPGEDPLDFADG